MVKSKDRWGFAFRTFEIIFTSLVLSGQVRGVFRILENIYNEAILRECLLDFISSALGLRKTCIRHWFKLWRRESAKLEGQIKTTGETIGTITFSKQLLLSAIQTGLARCLTYVMMSLSKKLSKQGKDPKLFLFLKFESIITKKTVKLTSFFKLIKFFI